MTDALVTSRAALKLLKENHGALAGELLEALDQAIELLESVTAAPAALPQVMTVGDLAAYLQVSQKAVYKLAQEGELPAAKVGDQWRFKRSLVDRWLAALSVKHYTGPKLPEEESNGPM